MSAVTLRCEAPAVPALPVHGVGQVAFARLCGGSALQHLYQHDPIRIQLPAQPAGEPPLAAIITTSGGLVGGDRIEIEAAVGDGAAALVMAQAAEKIYRSIGPDCRVDVRLSAGTDAWLEWLPQETIIFDGARLRRRTRIDLATGARVLAGEMLVFGRTASGERTRRGLVRDAWEITLDGRLHWADALHLDGNIGARLDDPFCFGGARAMAIAVLAGDGAAEHLHVARDLAAAQEDGDALRVGATVVNGVLLLRWLGADAARVRRGFGVAWQTLRAVAGGYAPRLPRLWHV